MRTCAVWLLVAFTLLLGGCRTRHGSLTMLSTTSIPLEFEVIHDHVVGRDCSHDFFYLFRFGMRSPTFDGALDDAIAQVNGADALSDVAIYLDRIVTIVYNRSCIRVEGRAIRIYGTDASDASTQGGK